MHVPFLLTVPLATPPAIALHLAPLMLDGVLLAALERRFGSSEAAGRPLPLARVEHGGQEIAFGSCAVAVTDAVAEDGCWIDLPVVNEHVHRVRSLRGEAQDLVERAAFGQAPLRHRSLQGTSPYRPRLRHYQTVAGISALAFIATGDAAAVVDLLGELPGLGAMSGQGYGEMMHKNIRAVQLKDAETAGLVFADGCPARTLPRTFWESLVDGATRRALSIEGTVVTGHWTAQPPYWQKGNETACVRPGPERLVRSFGRLQIELRLTDQAVFIDEVED